MMSLITFERNERRTEPGIVIAFNLFTFDTAYIRHCISTSYYIAITSYS